MKRVYSGVVAAGLCLSMMGSFTGCGEVKAYKTEHEFSDTKISSIKELFFEDKVSPEKVGRRFKDFCIYEDTYKDTTEYQATGNVQITFKDVKNEDINEDYGECILTGNLTIYFNADKEFQEWRLEDMRIYSVDDPDRYILTTTNDILEGELGDPDESIIYFNSKEFSWKINDYKISVGKTYIVYLADDEEDD